MLVRVVCSTQPEEQRERQSRHRPELVADGCCWNSVDAAEWVEPVEFAGGGQKAAPERMGSDYSNDTDHSADDFDNGGPSEVADSRDESVSGRDTNRQENQLAK